jgi:hypothetical protein
MECVMLEKTICKGKKFNLKYTSCSKAGNFSAIEKDFRSLCYKFVKMTFLYN